jgi:AraC family transcriptional regulator, regulatory protein of adaptative response / methylated-DNA-[protein]-cysteine methyltransferase
MVETDKINYRRVEEAIRFLTENVNQQPSLYEVAEHTHLSPYHFQKIFTEWAGISPKKFLQYLTVEELKKEISKTRNMAEAAERVGLSAQSRVYDLFVNIEAVTPQEFKTKGAGIEIAYGFHDTPFGSCLVATTGRGVCSMQFSDADEESALRELQRDWQQARIVKNGTAGSRVVQQLFSAAKKEPLNLLVKGTPFQVKVWEALLKIPFGSLATYQSVARAIGQPAATRAVGTAIGANPLAYLIPCHRVIRQEAIIGRYRWGTLRKKALIGWEKAKAE